MDKNKINKFDKLYDVISYFFKMSNSIYYNYLSKKVDGKKRRVTPEKVNAYANNNPNFILSDMGKNFGMRTFDALYWLDKITIRLLTQC